MLATIQVPYLNVDSRSTPLSRQHTQKIDFTDTSSSSWANIRHLTNEERDQIDLQAKVILMRCSDRVKEMELVEKSELMLDLCYSPAYPHRTGSTRGWEDKRDNALLTGSIATGRH